MSGASLLVVGTSSGAGKSTVVTGLCRWLHRHGVQVAPFKAQNMSNNSFVTTDGGEIGRAQAAQAQAAGVAPEVTMNPVLLKPGSDSRSHLIVLGQPAGDLDAATGWNRKHELLDTAVEAHRELLRRFDVVLCEGAGSPAEINLRSTDIVNMGFARAAGVPAVLVGDIDRGGVFASFVGTLGLLEPADQDLVRGFIINRFRGDRALLGPGLDQLRRITGRETLGVLPYQVGLELDAEDALNWSAWTGGGPELGTDSLTIGVICLPRASNLTDVEPLACEPGVAVRPLWQPDQMADCDLVIVPGTRATVHDLQWLRVRGFDSALARRAAAGHSILGICGGFQMLGTEIDDEVESGAGRVDGLGLLAVRTTFGAGKTVRQRQVTLDDGSVITGYEIHHGEVHCSEGEPFFAEEGCAAGTVAGSLWHGLFENDGWRRQYLVELAARCGKAFVPDNDVDFAARREARFDLLADLIDEHLDTSALEALWSTPRLPRLPRLAIGLT